MAYFGNATPGTTSTATPPTNNKAASRFNLAIAGTIDSIIVVYSSGHGASKAIIYADSAGTPGAFIAQSAELAADGTTGTYRYTFSPGVSLAAGNYWLGIWSVTAGTNSLCRALTSGIYFNAQTYSSGGSPANPFGSASIANFAYPIQATYAPALTAGTYAGNTTGADRISGTSGTSANNMAVIPISAPPLNVNSLVWCCSDVAASAHVKAVIYDASGAGGAPGALLGTSNQLTGIAAGVNTFTFPASVPVSGNIFAGIHTDAALVSHTATGATGYFKAATYASGPPSTFGAGSTTTNLATAWVAGTALATAARQGAVTVIT